MAYWLLLAALLVSPVSHALPFFAAVKAAVAVDPRPMVRWSSLNVGNSVGQADAHLLVFPGNRRYLIDAGEAGNGLLLRELRAQGATSVQKIFVTHAHRDHYGGIFSLIAANYPIGEVYLNMPSKTVCDTELPWGCNWVDIHRLLKVLADRKIPVKTMRAGDIHFSDGKISLQTLYAYSCDDNPIGVDQIEINDMSVVMRLENADTSVLFTGDLAEKMGEYLAVRGLRLEANLLKVPHHGVDSVAPNSFFKAVNPKAAVVPAPNWLWKQSRSNRVRAWLKARNIPTYVNGINGTINVKIFPNEWLFVPYF